MENDYDARMTELDRRIEESRKRLDEQQQRGIESLLGGSASSTVVPSISKYRRLGSRASGLDGYAERVADFLHSVPGTMYSVLKSGFGRLYSELSSVSTHLPKRRYIVQNKKLLTVSKSTEQVPSSEYAEKDDELVEVENWDEEDGQSPQAAPNAEGSNVEESKYERDELVISAEDFIRSLPMPSPRQIQDIWSNTGSLPAEESKDKLDELFMELDELSGEVRANFDSLKRKL